MTTRIRSLIAVAAVGIGVVGSTSCSPALAGSPKHPSAAGWPVVVTWHDYWVGGERSRQSVSVSSDGTVTINRDGATRTRKLAEPDTAALGALQYDGRLVASCRASRGRTVPTYPPSRSPSDRTTCRAARAPDSAPATSPHSSAWYRCCRPTRRADAGCRHLTGRHGRRAGRPPPWCTPCLDRAVTSPVGHVVHEGRAAGAGSERARYAATGPDRGTRRAPRR